jgi:hypothetical protein
LQKSLFHLSPPKKNPKMKKKLCLLFLSILIQGKQGEFHTPFTIYHPWQNVILKNLDTKLAEFELCMNGFFRVSFLTKCINAGGFLKVFVQFRPPLVGTHEGELIATYNNNNECMYCKLIGVGTKVGISYPFQINYLSDLYFEMDTFLRDLGDALLFDCLFSLHILNFSSQNLNAKVSFKNKCCLHLFYSIFYWRWTQLNQT